MSTAVTMTATDYLMVVQDGVNKKSSLTNLLLNLNSEDNIRVNPSQYSIDFSVGSKNNASMLFVDGSIDRIGVGTSTPESTLHVLGNAQVGSSSSNGILVQSSESIGYTTGDEGLATVKQLSPSRAVTEISCDANVSGLFSLPSGSNGQVKTIAVKLITGGETAIVTFVGLGPSGWTTITMSAIGSSITLQYLTSISKWVVLAVGSSTVVT